MDRIGAAALFAFGLAWAWMARAYDLMRDGTPGPGFLPTALGLIVAGLALLNFARPEVRRIDLPHLGRIATILGALVAYALVLEWVGYLIATALLLGFLLVALAERVRWWQPVAAVAVSLATYYVFRGVLQLPLPPGLLDLVA
jgi:putative tricarboxylic transport membrane protein